MPRADADCIVIGGGVAGLLAALRLQHAGLDVALVERERLGAGATLANHGILHSGALYVELHPEITTACQQAQAVFRQAFPSALLPTPPAWYVGGPARLDALRRRWDAHQITHEPVSPSELAGMLRPAVVRRLRAAAVWDRIISPRLLVTQLAQRCVDSGVRVLVDTPVQRILVAGGQVAGVELGAGERLFARQVVLAAGIGARPLLDALGSSVAERLRSRLDLMVAFPAMRLAHAIMTIDFGGPTIAPALGRGGRDRDRDPSSGWFGGTVSAAGGLALASRYGAAQPRVCRGGRWPVPAAGVAALGQALGELLADGVVDLDGGCAWVCAKTEVAAGHADCWGVEPNYAVVDHRAAEGLGGLWTLVPGKMTLAAHATRALAARLLGRAFAVGLEVPGATPTRIHARVAARGAPAPFAPIDAPAGDRLDQPAAAPAGALRLGDAQDARAGALPAAATLPAPVAAAAVPSGAAEAAPPGPAPPDAASAAPVPATQPATLPEGA